MKQEDILAIERLLSDFAWYADRGDGESLSRLFAPDGVLHVGGQQLAGRDAIARDCEQRHAQPGRKTRHLWSNLRIEAEDAHGARTTAVQMTVEQRDAKTETRINDLFDTLCRMQSGAWLITTRVISREIAF
ncbi:nuclear transport factor 2 family protein [Paraburkholderia susongensis]|uniref:SnoaL-like domain-containing protein n=1 Tax=Paraburkholderia susongensis TaxID=1515439 RepID=A0A1X7JGM8_9BURK|nr:nuclear transport factor 2 family protein [Paraburkholderia susongensis]SMG26701.1 conserved hypothetical protein [Paraburkholderia susongensis]